MTTNFALPPARPQPGQGRVAPSPLGDLAVFGAGLEMVQAPPEVIAALG